MYKNHRIHMDRRADQSDRPQEAGRRDDRRQFRHRQQDALAQAGPGATMLDVNAGVTASVNPNETEPPLLRDARDRPEPGRPAVLHRQLGAGGAQGGLEAAKGRPLVNSVTGEEERLEPSCRWSRSTTSRWSPSPTTRPAFPRIRTCASRSPRRSSSAPPTTASSRMTSSSIRWSCRSAPWAPPAARSSAGPPPARGAQGQHHLRRLQHLLRPAAPARHQRRLPADGRSPRA